MISTSLLMPTNFLVELQTDAIILLARSRPIAKIVTHLQTFDIVFMV